MICRLAVVLAMLSFSACTSAADVRQEPIRWTASYSVPFDTMANCVAEQMAQGWQATPQIYQRDGFAKVTLSDKGAPSTVAEFAVRGQGDAGSLVEWRRRAVIYDIDYIEAKSRWAADYCGGRGPQRAI
jgi:hypothetical protein